VVALSKTPASSGRFAFRLFFLWLKKQQSPARR
jgi:hypothetical protein